MSADIFIFSVLLLINALLALTMLLAARTLGQPAVALLMAAAFGCNVLLYIADSVHFLYYQGNIWINLGVSGLALMTPILATAAFRRRSGLRPRPELFAAGYAAALLAILWLSTVNPNVGLRGAVLPIHAAIVMLVGVHAMWRRGRSLRLGERPIIVTGCLLAATEICGGIVLAASGNSASNLLNQAYVLIVYLGLPAMTVAAGIFSLYLLAGDLAARLGAAADTDALTSAPNGAPSRQQAPG